MSDAPMTAEDFITKLEAVITAARERGLSDEAIILVLGDTIVALREADVIRAAQR